jgi:HK97 family phage major capsid protein
MKKADLLAAMEAKRQEREARHKKIVDLARKKAGTDEGRKQIRSWVKAIQDEDKAGLKAVSDEVAKEYRSQNITTPADGGYLVPTIVEANIIEQLKLIAPLRSLFTVIPNAPAKLQIGSQTGRPSVAWTAEEAAYYQTKATFGTATINAHKLTGIVPITEEFMQDVANYPAVQALLERQLAEAIGLQENAAFISGDGVTRPLGFRNLTLPAGQDLNYGAALTDLNYDDVKALKRAIKRAYRGNTGFIANEAVEAQLDGVKDSDGKYIYNPNVADENDFTRLLGRNFLTVDGTDELTQNELWFVNGASYWITDVTGIRIDFGYATGDFEEGRQSLRVMKRTGGAPVDVNGFARTKQGI